MTFTFTSQPFNDEMSRDITPGFERAYYDALWKVFSSAWPVKCHGDAYIYNRKEVECG